MCQPAEFKKKKCLPYRGTNASKGFPASTLFFGGLVGRRRFIYFLSHDTCDCVPGFGRFARGELRQCAGVENFVPDFLAQRLR
jgi:hypothetical protein